MIVALRVSIVVDRADWDAAFGTGTDVDVVRADVRSYFQEHIGAAEAIEDASLTVVTR